MPNGLANGTTIVFATSGFTGSIRRIGGSTATREAIDNTHLATTGQRTKIPGFLVDPGTTEVEIEWNQSFTKFPPIDAVPETITISYPKRTGETVPATEAGTGFLTEVTGPTCEDGSLMVGRYTITWDGLTDHTYTKGS